MIFQERLKKEYKSANKQRDTGVDESDEETEGPTTSKQAKAMQKLIRNREDNEAYESDDEKNPYATSVSLLFYLVIFALLTILCRRRRRKRRNHPLLRQQDLLYNSSNNRWNLDRKLQNPYQLVQPLQLLRILERLHQHSLLDMAAIRLSPSARRALRYRNPRRRIPAEALALLEANPRWQETEVQALPLKHGMVSLAQRRVRSARQMTPQPHHLPNLPRTPMVITPLPRRKSARHHRQAPRRSQYHLQSSRRRC